MMETIAVAETTAKERRDSQEASSNVAWGLGLIVVALIAVIYGDILAAMAVDWWTDPSSSHGLLVPPLAVYIAWRQRDLTLAVPVTRELKGVLWIFGACVVLLVGKLGAEFFLSRVSFVLLLSGLIYAFWGAGRLRTLVFPLTLLATMVPLPVIVYNSLALPLQLFASRVAAKVAQAFGVSVFQEGNVIQLADTTLGVAEACSGLRSLSALAVMALLLGFLQCRHPVTRVLLFLSALPIAVFVNVVRVSGTAILADHDYHLAMGFYHAFSGWLVFLFGIALVVGTAQLLHRFIDKRL